MTDDDARRHLEQLGLPVTGGIPPAALAEAAAAAGGPLPPLLAWLLSRSAGATFPEAVTYRHPGVDDALLGWFVDEGELRDGLERVPPGLVPLVADESGNLLAVGVAGPYVGQVVFVPHDSPVLTVVHRSFRDFLAELQPGR